MFEELNSCHLCPRNCNVNRNKNILGFCQAPSELVVARASLHYWEEPCLSKEEGSGTIFFSYCNLKCIFCQNYDISTLNRGKAITTDRLAEICLELQAKKANNINLVTPTHFVPLIKEALIKAKNQGLTIPIIYNSSAYEHKETLKLLEGLIDIYLPDLKYLSDEYALKYSNCPNYFLYAKEAIAEMYRQVGPPEFNDQGLMTKGLIVRHLVLPGHTQESQTLINYLYKTYRDNIYISIMNQYTPIKKLPYEELNHQLDQETYDNIINYAYDLGIRQAFIQDDETQSESFIPTFNNEGV